MLSCHFYQPALAFLLLAGTARAYQLKHDYTENNYASFFGKFDFWTQSDPTHGYVDYVNQNSAWDNGLIGNGGNIYLGVDTKTTASGRGRKAVRLTSQNIYQPGTLVVADIAHMPETCGTWPAFWMTSATSSWPQEGEIDIVEQANNAKNNQMSIHVSEKQGQCFIEQKPDMLAKPDRFNECSEEAHGGCDANDPRGNSFGSGFNSNGGGVYAMEWTASKISIWFFARNSTPSGEQGPLGSSPKPSTWGTPTTVFRGRNGNGCNLSNHIKNQRIIINTTFCGKWADGTWESSGCRASTGHSTCKSFVKNNHSAFRNAFWTFKSIKTYV